MKSKTTITFLIASLLWAFMALSSEACTTGVISGKFTKSGRPMIWKVRDTETYQNAVKRYTDGPIEYIGLINATDSIGEQIWGGHNAAGFAIMNSASFNVNEGYKGEWIDREGYFMHQALRECRTLEDFEALLNNRPKPMGLAAHFGVIDANGGAAFYEVNNEGFTKYDANDPEQAPRGYILRTNFSETGIVNKGYGFIRLDNAKKLFSEVPEGALTVADVMQQFSRSMYHDVFKVDYRKIYSQEEAKARFVATDDMICRYGTSSTITVEGVAKGEDPSQTTSWVQVGLPNVSVSLPVWTGLALPSILEVNPQSGTCPLGKVCMELKNKIYPMHERSDGYHYVRIDLLFNKEQTGITQQIEKAEKAIFEQTEQSRLAWRQNPNKYRGNALVQSKQELTDKFEQLSKTLYANCIGLALDE